MVMMGTIGPALASSSLNPSKNWAISKAGGRSRP